MVSRTPVGGRSRSVEARHTATLRPARLLGANRDFDARLLGGGSYEGQRRCAFSLYQQENISERTPRRDPIGASTTKRREVSGADSWQCSKRPLVGAFYSITSSGACKYRWRHSRRTVRTDIRGRE